LKEIDRLIDGKKYQQIIEHLREIEKPRGTWDRDLKEYLNNVIMNCIEHAEAILELLGEELERDDDD